MVRTGHTFDRRVAAALTMVALAMALLPLARAADGPRPRPATIAAPLEIPHVTDRALAEKAQKSQSKPTSPGNYDFLTLGLQPLQWPNNADVLRSNLLTPQLKSTPVVGWLAENLYRDKADNGWCVQLDGGDYVVLYRYYPKK